MSIIEDTPPETQFLSIFLLFLARSCIVLHLIEQDNNFDAMHACSLTIIPSYQKLFFTHSSVNSIHLIIFPNKTTNSAFPPKYDDDNKPTGPWWKCCLCDTLECIESRKPISRCQNMLHNFCRAWTVSSRVSKCWRGLLVHRCPTIWDLLHLIWGRLTMIKWTPN